MAQPQAACKMLSQLHAIDSTLKVLIDFRKQLRPIDISMISMIPNVGGKAREKEVAYLESTTDWLIVSLDCRFKDGRQIFEMCKESSNSSIFFARNQEQSRRQFCCFFPERMNGCLPN